MADLNTYRWLEEGKAHMLYRAEDDTGQRAIGGHTSRTGQYVAGTTFLEGLVRHQGKWLLYYGCADSFVGVAVAEGGAG